MTQLNKLGAKVTETKDGLHFQGVDKLHGADLDSMSDHRVLMSFFVAGCLAESETTITDAGAAAVSYPGFLDDMQQAGVKFRLEDPKSE
jgi:3-phosphoshikimate 1-carboxyvinyltransferase